MKSQVPRPRWGHRLAVVALAWLAVAAPARADSVHVEFAAVGRGAVEIRITTLEQTRIHIPIGTILRPTGGSRSEEYVLAQDFRSDVPAGTVTRHALAFRLYGPVPRVASGTALVRSGVCPAELLPVLRSRTPFAERVSRVQRFMNDYVSHSGASPP